MGDGDIVFSPSHGLLAPHEEVEVEMTLTPPRELRLRTEVECVVAQGDTQGMTVRAEVQEPKCYVSTHGIEMGPPPSPPPFAPRPAC